MNRIPPRYWTRNTALKWLGFLVALFIAPAWVIPGLFMTPSLLAMFVTVFLLVLESAFLARIFLSLWGERRLAELPR